jgi:predicted TIM-barrel fold metal-dependent hydrolase
MYIFDSLTHISLGDNALWDYKDANQEKLLREMDESMVKRAMVCLIESLEPGKSRDFGKVIQKENGLYGISSIDYGSKEKMRREINELKENGYIGIKIHPRFQSLPWEGTWLADMLNAANSAEMFVAYCTYSFTRANEMRGEPYNFLVDAIGKVPEAKIILMHGGGTDVLKYSELVRHSENLLLDLSFTLCKYKGSSIDFDLRFLFENFDQRICIGSDFPDFSPCELSERFNLLSKDLDPEKKTRIAHSNIESFIGIDPIKNEKRRS